MRVFICDGSPLTFFTAVFTAYKENDCFITSDGNIQLSIDSEAVQVYGDEEKAERVARGLAKYDGGAVEDIVNALRSCNGLKEQIAFEYIKKIFEKKKKIKNAYNLQEVVKFNDILYKITGETHRFTGFLRFMETADGVLYAPYSPDNDITELLMPHFAARLQSEKFVIHDLGRKKAGMYNGGEWIICRADEAEICLSAREKAFETLWKRYYKSVNIKERPHEKQMKGYMPVRYWKFLPEKND